MYAADYLNNPPLTSREKRLVEVLRCADQRIAELCRTVNTIAGFRKTRAEDYADKVRAILDEIDGKESSR